MNYSHQEMLTDIQEMDIRSAPMSKQRRIIHFSSGEMLEIGDSEEEEEEERQQSSNRPSFSEPTKRTRFSFKTVALLVGRISLMTCDFLGERLAGALGLNAAKYQYAVDQYHRDHKTTGQRTPNNDFTESQAETNQFSSDRNGSCYGATGEIKHPVDSQDDEKHTDKNKGSHNRGYQADED